ncbi:MAG: ABC transporter permease subunit [Rhodobacteraceae bacterium]|nr:ABC transporter permease subunit [Paracoccaceae bacterium]
MPRWLPGVVRFLRLWEGAAWWLAGRFLLAGPLDVIAHAWANAGLLTRAAAVTLENAAWGFVIGNLAAVALALMALALPRGAGVVAGLALVVFCLPLVATAPILRVLYGPGSGPQITIAALAVYYTTFIPLMVGLRAAPASWFDLIRLYGRGGPSALVQVRAMAALPYLVAGLQIAAPAAILGAMIGEFTGADRGLGVLVIRAMRGLDVTATWTLATISAAVAMAGYGALGALGRWLAPDRPEALLTPPPASATRLAERAAIGALTVLVVLLLWWAAMELADLNRFFAKRPDDVWRFLVTAPQAAAARATLAAAMVETLLWTIPGYVAGLVLGAALAAVLTLYPAAAGSVMPIAVALRSVPIVTTAPLIVLMLGRGATGTIAIVAVMTFFPALVACLQGLRQAPGQVLDVFAAYAARPVQRLLHAQLPAMLPAFFAAARMSVPAAVLAVTVAEWLATGRGMGHLMALSASTSNYNMLWSATATLAAVSALGYAGVALLERRALRRYAPEQLS